MSREELEGLVYGLAASDAVSMRSSPCIRLGKVELDAADGGRTADGETADDADRPHQGFGVEAIAELRDVFECVREGGRIDTVAVAGVVRNLMTGFAQDVNPLNLLASLKLTDSYTFAHVVNVTVLTMSLAESLGFSGDLLHGVGVAAALHDVGKIFIPEEILNKPGKLTEEERAVIEGHAAKGAACLLDTDGAPKLAVLTALEHHIRYDGSGYPRMEGGWEPNLVSQMISVADVYDALRTKRPYRGPMEESRIVEILREGSGSAFNPRLVESFLLLLAR
jgi:HD-GYP domain-containing protein (c-di-GMP phosphodiesterase class II)